MVNRVTLTDTEVLIAEIVGKERKRKNGEVGICSDDWTGQGKERQEINAFGAEMAFCKFIGVYPDFSTDPRSGGSDCEYNGCTYDVKHTPRLDGNLIVDIDKELGMSDFYVLVRGDMPTYEVVGWVHEAHIIKKNMINHRLPVPGYFMNAGDLKEFKIEQRV